MVAGPFPYPRGFLRISAPARSLAPGRWVLDGRLDDIPGGLHIAEEKGVQFFGMLIVQVDGILPASIAKFHRLGSLGPIEVINEHRAAGHKDIPFPYCS